MQEILPTVPARHAAHLVAQLVLAKCVCSAELHITLLTLKLVCAGVKVDMFLQVTGLLEGLLTNVTFEGSFT